MAIRFRCEHCDTLMSIATRKAGSMVRCPSCKAELLVPQLDPAPAPPEKPTVPVEEAPAAGLSPGEMPNDTAPAPEDDVGFREFFDNRPTGHLPDAPLEVSPQPIRPPILLDEDPFAIPVRGMTINDEMDLTPMVDVVFQLLIFFMVTASFALHKTIQTPTPDADQKGATQSIQTLDDLEGVAILVRVDGQNAITIDDEPLKDGANVADALRDKMRKEQKSEIIITADNAAWHRTVVGVIDASNEVGMQKIRLTTRGSINE